MTTVSALPAAGDAFFDVRDDGRSMRVAWHPAGDLFVLSIWRDRRCAATFRMDRTSALAFIDTLVTGIAAPLER